MPQYVQPGLAQTNQLDAQANQDYNLGATAGDNSDNYVRIVVYLTTVLFLVGISGHFRVRGRGSASSSSGERSSSSRW